MKGNEDGRKTVFLRETKYINNTMATIRHSKDPLSVTHPDLVKEWDYDKNAPLIPEKITFGSNKKVWWKCLFGHEWEAVVYARVRGNGCPYCSGNKVLLGYNDLQTKYPDIAKEWNYEKNSGMTPKDVTFGSRKKVWWKCSHGHEWEASIGNRTGCNKAGCPFCHGHICKPGINDLQTTYPQIAQEWHPKLNGDFSPSDVAYGSQKKAWWLGKCGHEWQSNINNRTANGNGCPFCDGRLPIKGKNDFASSYPQIAKEWDYERNGKIKPDSITNHSSRKVWWICEKGHSWCTTVSHRADGEGCPICRGEKSTSFPEQAVLYYVKQLFSDVINRYKPEWLKEKSANGEIDVYIPSIKVGIEYDGRAYHQNPERDNNKDKLCKEHGIWLIRVREPDCPKLIEESNCIDIQSTSGRFYYEEALVELINLLRKTYDIDTDIVVNIKKDYSDILSSYEHLNQKKSVAVINPHLIEEWNVDKNGNLSPYSISYGSARLVWWKCSACKNEWQDTPKHRNKGRGCPQCAKMKRIDTRRRLAVQKRGSFRDWCLSHGDRGFLLLKEWSPANTIKPDDLTHGSMMKIYWRCSECSNVWQSSVNSRVHGTNCPICAKLMRVVSRNKTKLTKMDDLATKDPRLSKEWDYEKNKPLTPSQVTTGSIKKVWWKCENGHVWYAAINERTYHRTGCPKCAKKRVANKNQKCVVCVETQIVYPSIKEAALNTGCIPSSISQVLRGRNKTAGGYHWRLYKNSLV